MLPRCFLTMRFTVSRPRPVPSPTPLVVKKGWKKMRQNFRRNSWTVICDLNYHAVVILISAHPKLSLARHGIDGIIDEVCPCWLNSLPKEFTNKEFPRYSRLTVTPCLSL